MARYTREHKQETRQRIIATAGRRIKRSGIDGSGVATLMKDAGLTNGAFYAHFGSKDDLVDTAIAHELDLLHSNIVEQTGPGAAGLEQLVRWYLSPDHRDNPVDGCPNAALLDEIGRSGDTTRQAYTDGVLVVIDGLAARMTPEDPLASRVTALSLLGMMVGTVQLARALTDRQLSDHLLEQGLRNALALVGTELRP
ncbi:transcriptional regulator, TetR family [Promicromonospora umidemergens]|uniref:TetR/AcrR family transcriptional regulator n=1 Tax=Promicromonospora umidemergens TaxID=629679 RepID=A0ABP8XKX0_9MICO|nr:TetR/AcrR family transcriptional regulator [Promicromonospora umidemergens]MCP2282062.1 transcriptional regulator, TetR family [Promicromonospora umidemergens]